MEGPDRGRRRQVPSGLLCHRGRGGGAVRAPTTALRPAASAGGGGNRQQRGHGNDHQSSPAGASSSYDDDDGDSNRYASPSAAHSVSAATPDAASTSSSSSSSSPASSSTSGAVGASKKWSPYKTRKPQPQELNNNDPSAYFGAGSASEAIRLGLGGKLRRSGERPNGFKIEAFPPAGSDASLPAGVGGMVVGGGVSGDGGGGVVLPMAWPRVGAGRLYLKPPRGSGLMPMQSHRPHGAASGPHGHHSSLSLNQLQQQQQQQQRQQQRSCRRRSTATTTTRCANAMMMATSTAFNSTGRSPRPWALARGAARRRDDTAAHVPQVGDQVVYYQRAHEEADEVKVAFGGGGFGDFGGGGSKAPEASLASCRPRPMRWKRTRPAAAAAARAAAVHLPRGGVVIGQRGSARRYAARRGLHGGGTHHRFAQDHPQLWTAWTLPAARGGAGLLLVRRARGPRGAGAAGLPRRDQGAHGLRDNCERLDDVGNGVIEIVGAGEKTAAATERRADQTAGRRRRR